jgi:hypothetical protein
MFIDHLADVKQEKAGRILADDSCRADAIMQQYQTARNFKLAQLDSLSAC